MPAGVIAIAPVTDANKAEPTAGVVRSLQFHPNGQLLLTAGLDKRLRLFQVLPGAAAAWHLPMHLSICAAVIASFQI